MAEDRRWGRRGGPAEGDGAEEAVALQGVEEGEVQVCVREAG